MDGGICAPSIYRQAKRRVVRVRHAAAVRAIQRQRILRLASVLNPAGIPESVFTTTAAHDWLTDARTTIGGGAHTAAELDAVAAIDMATRAAYAL